MWNLDISSIRDFAFAIAATIMELVLALFWHFVAYFHSWKGSVALVIGALLVYKFWPRRTSGDLLLPTSVKRYDCDGRSHLDDYEPRGEEDDQNPAWDQDHEMEQVPAVQALFVYPLKSCKGIEVPVARVTRTGFKYDRLFSLAELPSEKSDLESKPHWRFITQREYPKLALIDTELWLPDDVRMKAKNRPVHDPVRDVRANGGYLLVRFVLEDEPVILRLPLFPTPERAVAKGYQQSPLTVWLDNPQAIDVTSEVTSRDLEKLSRFLGVKHSLGLFRVDESNLRTITRSLPKDQSEDDHFEVGFADAFPVHLINVASVRRLRRSIPDQTNEGSSNCVTRTSSPPKDPLDVRRLRANIIVSGASAYSEDCWKRLTIGTSLSDDSQPAVYHAACRTARCPVLNVDQDAGIMARHEPLRTLKKTRVVDEGARPYAVLGLSMIPLCKLGRISVGDRIEVLETGEHLYEKMFK